MKSARALADAAGIEERVLEGASLSRGVTLVARDHVDEVAHGGSRPCRDGDPSVAS